MDTPYAVTRKIDPTRGPRLPDGTPNDANRVEIGPTPLALHEWEAASLAAPNLATLRAFRLSRLTDALATRDYAGLLMFDPLNIRYATDSTNMQLWNAHNPFRACLVCPDGHMVLWDYDRSPFLSEFNPLVSERRGGASMFYFATGDTTVDAARRFSAEVAEILSAHSPGNRRLAVDKPMLHGVDALRQQGFELLPGEEVTEHARAVKCADEIAAMRCAIHACEASMQVMEDFARTHVPKGGVTENDIWAVLHAENIRRGGEWIETRLLTSGPRTNPWFQECGPREVQQNEILAFDTDLIGPYGICTDISRTWWLGDGPAPAPMRAAMAHAVEHIEANTALIRPGLTIPEWTAQSHRLAPQYAAGRYSCLAHGVGLCDEWPHVAYPEDDHGGFDYPLLPGMVLCVEALVGETPGDFCIKLEEQVLVTESGHERLSSYPFDPRLLP